MKPHIPQSVVDRARRLCAVHPQLTVCDIIGVSPNTLWRWQKNGWRATTRKLRPVPNDWGIVAPGKSRDELRAHYRTSYRAIARWQSERPVDRPCRTRAKPLPSDLAEVLARMSVGEACAHYGVSNETLTRWRRRVGIPVRFEPAPSMVGWVERYVERRLAA